MWYRKLELYTKSNRFGPCYAMFLMEETVLLGCSGAQKNQSLKKPAQKPVFLS